MKTSEKKENKRRALFILFWALIVLAICFGTSYAYINLNTTPDDNNVVESGCLKLSISENEGINLKDSLPMFDSSGMNQKPYSFSITNTCTLDAKYILSLNLIAPSTSADAKNVKVALSGDYLVAPKLLSDYQEIYLNDKPKDVTNSYYLSTGYLKPNENVNYDLRMWIDIDATSLNDFYSKVMVEAIVNED